MGELGSLENVRAKSRGAQMLERLRKGTKNHVMLQWPGADEGETFALVPLLTSELQECYAGAFERFKSLGLEVNPLTSDDFWGEMEVQILARAIRDPIDTNLKRTLFHDADELRDSIDPDTRTWCSNHYVDLKDKCNPNPHDLDEDQFKEIEELVKKKDTTKLSVMPSRTLANYVIGMASRSTN